ncbi:hypothetical protein I4J42_04560 [Corynebacterium belfantii]|uniref:hypothetical protein n=1 Tax=Corynebacterium belfantii TaxID=2014537 RepID=UPI0018D4D58A|nr:hypothetical protein [Corynebacterium belfantii]MBG9333144.1 hypothetical protein [Corynebacterium belfantii]
MENKIETLRAGIKDCELGIAQAFAKCDWSAARFLIRQANELGYQLEQLEEQEEKPSQNGVAAR